MQRKLTWEGKLEQQFSGFENTAGYLNPFSASVGNGAPNEAVNPVNSSPPPLPCNSTLAWNVKVKTPNSEYIKE